MLIVCMMLQCNARRGPYVAYQIKTAVYEPTVRYVAFYLTFHMTSLHTFLHIKKDANNSLGCLGEVPIRTFTKGWATNSIHVLDVKLAF